MSFVLLFLVLGLRLVDGRQAAVEFAGCVHRALFRYVTIAGAEFSFWESVKDALHIVMKRFKPI